MEFDDYRPWAVRLIQWCLLCRAREENGEGADLCARCQADVEAEVTNG